MSNTVSLFSESKKIALLCIFAWCLCGNSRAALDAETKKPYQLTVVVHIAKHRLLTEVFRDRLEREVRDGLQAALGELAEVQVVHEHPQLANVLENGLQRALDGWKDRSAGKTHFVLLDFSGVQYELQTRQYDGLTGLPSPVVRHEQTQDREFVARTAVLMIERDFGILGTFAAWPKGAKPQLVQLELKGGRLDAPMSRWVQKGDVFAVVQVPTGNGIGRRVPFTLIQIETPPEDGGAGTCTGNLFWRFAPPTGGVAGYRCIKLGAVRGPLHVRLVQVKPDGSPGELLSSPTLLVRHHGFTGEDGARLELRSHDKAVTYDTNKLGDIGLFDRIAFISVKDGKSIRAEIPLPLLDAQLVTLPVTLTDNDVPPLVFLRRDWMRSVLDNYEAQSTTFKELQELSAKKDVQRDKLIDIAMAAAKRSAAEVSRLATEQRELFGDPKTLTDLDRRDLAQAGQRLQEIREGEKELLSYVDRQRALDKEENDPKHKEWRAEIERGKLFERDGELPKAIHIYATLLDTEGFKNDDLAKHLQKLRDVWKPKSDKHRAARTYIYDLWPTLDTAALATELKDASEALNECIKAGDYLGPQKLYKGIQLHAGRLLKEAEGLRDINEEDAKQLKVIKEITGQLSKLETEIKAYLDKAPK